MSVWNIERIHEGPRVYVFSTRLPSTDLVAFKHPCIFKTGETLGTNGGSLRRPADPNATHIEFIKSRLQHRAIAPLSEGRWRSHLTAAAGLLTDGGQVTAVLPNSAKNQDMLPGFDLEWSPVIENAFAGTTVSVVILVARKR